MKLVTWNYAYSPFKECIIIACLSYDFKILIKIMTYDRASHETWQ